MDKNRIAIATMTLGRDEQEELFLRESLSLLARLKIKTFVTDGGSGKEFIRFLGALPDFHVSEAAAPGVFRQIKNSLQAARDSAAAAAAGTNFILYTEPDKKLFFDRRLDEFIAEATAAAGENIGIILASRSAGSFATFPAFQQYTESVINNLCAEITGVAADYTYGPFLFNPVLMDYLELLPDEIGWGWRPYLFGAARRAGYAVVQLAGDYPCPLEQRQDDRAERVYRMKQLAQSIEGLILSTGVNLPREGLTGA